MRSTVLPVMLSTSCYWIVGIGRGIGISQFTSIGVTGIWIGFCLGLTSAAALIGVLAFNRARETTKEEGKTECDLAQLHRRG